MYSLVKLVFARLVPNWVKQQLSYLVDVEQGLRQGVYGVDELVVCEPVVLLRGKVDLRCEGYWVPSGLVAATRDIVDGTCRLGVSRTIPSSTTMENAYDPRRRTFITVRGTVTCTNPGRCSSSLIHPSTDDPAQITGENLVSATATYTYVLSRLFGFARSSFFTGSLVAGQQTFAVNVSVSPLVTFMRRRGVHGTFIPCGRSAAMRFFFL